MKLFKTTLLICMFLFLVACDDEDQTVQLYDYTIQIAPKLSSNETIIGDLSGLKVEINDAHRGDKIELISDKDGKVHFSWLAGVYKVKVSGKLRCSSVVDGIEIEKNQEFGGVTESMLLASSILSGSTDIYPVYSDRGLVIKEMYTASTRTVNGSALRFDQFIEIYNNSDTIMYADGLAIGETLHQTASVENIYTSDWKEKTFLWTIYAIPGKSGDKKVPIAPGKSIVIAPQPIDHRPDNSIDLRPPVSDYQWFDAYGSGQYSIDVPEVPNLERCFATTLSVWVVTVQMNRGFVIFQLPDGWSMSKYVEDNTDRRMNAAGNMVTSIGVKNDYIIDAVDLGDKTNFYSKSLFPALDQGYSYTVQAYNGKSIRRKILKTTADGRVVYKDTNDSSVDFWTSCTPSPKRYPTDDEISHE